LKTACFTASGQGSRPRAHDKTTDASFQKSSAFLDGMHSGGYIPFLIRNSKTRKIP
jgi:hypothetical protein